MAQSYYIPRPVIVNVNLMFRLNVTTKYDVIFNIFNELNVVSVPNYLVEERRETFITLIYMIN